MILEMKHRAWCMLSQHRSTALHPCSLASPPLIHTYSLRSLDAEAGELLSIGGQPRPQCETPHTHTHTKEEAEERKEKKDVLVTLRGLLSHLKKLLTHARSFFLTLKSVLVWVVSLFAVPAQIHCFSLVWCRDYGREPRCALF